MVAVLIGLDAVDPVGTGLAREDDLLGGLGIDLIAVLVSDLSAVDLDLHGLGKLCRGADILGLVALVKDSERDHEVLDLEGRRYIDTAFRHFRDAVRIRAGARTSRHDLLAADNSSDLERILLVTGVRIQHDVDRIVSLDIGA